MMAFFIISNNIIINIAVTQYKTWTRMAEAIGTTGRVSNAIGYRHDRSGLQHR